MSVENSQGLSQPAGSITDQSRRRLEFPLSALIGIALIGAKRRLLADKQR
jgi:hypothetical protein